MEVADMTRRHPFLSSKVRFDSFSSLLSPAISRDHPIAAVVHNNQHLSGLCRPYCIASFVHVIDICRLVVILLPQGVEGERLGRGWS